MIHWSTRSTYRLTPTVEPPKTREASESTLRFLENQIHWKRPMLTFQSLLSVMKILTIRTQPTHFSGILIHAKISKSGEFTWKYGSQLFLEKIIWKYWPAFLCRNNWLEGNSSCHTALSSSSPQMGHDITCQSCWGPYRGLLSLQQWTLNILRCLHLSQDHSPSSPSRFIRWSNWKILSRLMSITHSSLWPSPQCYYWVQCGRSLSKGGYNGH